MIGNKTYMNRQLVNFLPFTLGSRWDTVKCPLKYIGTYYYERFEVYELTDKLIDKLCNHLVSKIELVKFDDLVIGIKVYFDVDVTCYDNVRLEIDKEVKVKGKLTSSWERLNYGWKNSTQKLDLIVGKDERLILIYSIGEYEL